MKKLVYPLSCISTFIVLFLEIKSIGTTNFEEIFLSNLSIHIYFSGFLYGTSYYTGFYRDTYNYSLFPLNYFQITYEKFKYAFISQGLVLANLLSISVFFYTDISLSEKLVIFLINNFSLVAIHFMSIILWDYLNKSNNNKHYIPIYMLLLFLPIKYNFTIGNFNQFQTNIILTFIIGLIGLLFSFLFARNINRETV